MKTLKLIREKAKKRVGKKIVVSKDDDGNVFYSREDTLGLLSILRKFDTRIHTMGDMKMWTKLMGKLDQVSLNMDTEIELSVNEENFLVDYLSHIDQKEGKNIQLSGIEASTLFNVLDGLGIDSEEGKK